MDFQQSQTYQNLLSAYNDELKNTATFELCSDQARQEGYIEIASAYDVAARNEKEHARIWLRKINNGVLPTTEQNLKTSSENQLILGNDIYREYARTAQDEGYNDIAALFNGVANIELNHELTFRTFYNDLITNELFCKPSEVLWICMQCGNIMSNACAPEICPVCLFPQGYYRLYDNLSV